MPEGFKLLDAYVEVHADAKGVGAEAESQLRGQAGTFNRVGSGFGSTLMGGMQGVIGGLVGGVVSAFAQPLVSGVQDALSSAFQAAKSAVIDYNGQLEQANIGFTTMLGSAGKAKDFINDLQVFAKKTPFAFTDLTNYSQQMIGYGINAKKVVPYLTALGDAAAGAGKSSADLGNAVLAFEQMAAKGTVDLGNLNQLTNAGIPAVSILAEKYHVSKGALIDMVSAGKLASDQALPKLIQGIEKGTKSTAAFGGMMSKQSETLQGAMGNISDAFNQTISSAGLPFFKVIERIAKKIADFAGSKGFQNWAKDTAKNIGDFISKVEKGVKSVFGDKGVQKSVGNFGKALSEAFKEVGPAVDKILPNLIQFGKDVLPAIIDAATGIIKKIPTLLEWWGTLSDGLAQAGPTIAGVIGFFSDLSGTLFDVSKNIVKFAIQAVNNFTHFRDKAQNIINGVVRWMATAGTNIVQGLIGGITGAINGAVSAAQNLANGVKDTFANILGIQSPSKVFHQYGTWVAEGLHKGLLGSVDQIKSAGEKLADAVDKPMKAGVERVTKRLVDLAKRRDQVIDKLATAKDVLSGLKDDRASYKSGVIGSLIGSGGAGDITSLFQPGTSTTTSSSAAYGSLDGRGYQASYSTSSTVTTPGGLTGVRASLRKMVADTKAFTANIKKLVKMGLDRFSVQELIQAGPTASLPITAELLNDRAGFNDLVSLQKQLNSASTALGEYGAGYTYDSQIKSATGTVNRLRNTEKAIVVNMIVEARKIDEVDKVVKMVHAIKSTAKAKKAGAKK